LTRGVATTRIARELVSKSETVGQKISTYQKGGRRRQIQRIERMKSLVTSEYSFQSQLLHL